MTVKLFELLFLLSLMVFLKLADTVFLRLLPAYKNEFLEQPSSVDVYNEQERAGSKWWKTVATDYSVKLMVLA